MARRATRIMREADGDQRFRSSERLCRRADIARVFAQRRSASDSLMTVYVADNGRSWSRLGITVSRRSIRSSVRRNRVRRRIREFYRTHKSRFPRGLDILCIARSAAADADIAALGASLEALVIRGSNRSPRSEAGSTHQSSGRKAEKRVDRTTRREPRV